MEHRVSAMGFARMLDALLHSSSVTPAVRKDILHELLQISDRVWRTFAMGVRLKHHDPYYENHVDAWRHAYEKEMADLEGYVLKCIERFDDVRDDRRLPADIEDMVIHPEKYKFEPLDVNSIGAHWGDPVTVGPIAFIRLKACGEADRA